MSEWSEPMTYDAVIGVIGEFVPGRGRYGSPQNWGRWLREDRLLTQLDRKFHRMMVGMIISVQRQSDNEWLDIQKVAQ